MFVSLLRLNPSPNSGIFVSSWRIACFQGEIEEKGVLNPSYGFCIRTKCEAYALLEGRKKRGIEFPNEICFLTKRGTQAPWGRRRERGTGPPNGICVLRGAEFKPHWGKREGYRKLRTETEAVLLPYFRIFEWEEEEVSQIANNVIASMRNET